MSKRRVLSLISLLQPNITHLEATYTCFPGEYQPYRTLHIYTHTHTHTHTRSHTTRRGREQESVLSLRHRHTTTAAAPTHHAPNTRLPPHHLQRDTSDKNPATGPPTHSQAPMDNHTGAHHLLCVSPGVCVT